MLALLGYASCVSLTTLRNALQRLFPEECTGADMNFRMITLGCVLAWLLLPAALVPRVLVRVSRVAHDLCLSSTTQDEEMELQAMHPRGGLPYA